MESVYFGVFFGFAEFLPLSASGVLALLRSITGIEPRGAWMGALGLGCFFALLVWVRKRLTLKKLGFAILHSVPTWLAFAVFGWLNKLIQADLLAVCAFIVISSGLMGLSCWFFRVRKEPFFNGKFGFLSAFFQALLVLPGFGRQEALWLGSYFRSERLNSEQLKDWFLITLVPLLFSTSLLSVSQLGVSNSPELFPINGFDFGVLLLSAFVFGNVSLWIFERFFGWKLFLVSSVLRLSIGSLILILSQSFP